MKYVKNVIKRYLGITGLRDGIGKVVEETVAEAIKDQTYVIARGLATGSVPWSGGTTRELSTVLHKLVKASTSELAEKKVVELVAKAIEDTGIDTEEFIDKIVVRLKAKQLD